MDAANTEKDGGHHTGAVDRHGQIGENGYTQHNPKPHMPIPYAINRALTKSPRAIFRQSDIAKGPDFFGNPALSCVLGIFAVGIYWLLPYSATSKSRFLRIITYPLKPETKAAACSAVYFVTPLLPANL